MNELDLKKTLSLLGLAMRAGKAITGEDEIEKAVRKGRAKIILVANDASIATKKRYMDLSRHYEISCAELQASKEELGSAIGKDYRAAVAVSDAGFSKALRKLTDSKAI
jgi:ribosomal protein L7Ae-like RNA K-turn-binding protein